MLHTVLAAAEPKHSSIEIAVALTIWPAIVVLLWLLPTIIASRRHLANVGSIAVINVFLGWLPVVWVICLALACQSARTCCASCGHSDADPSWPPPRPQRVRSIEGQAGRG